ncbi:MAG: response regulator [Deltaproteobacteria bacterium]|nr:response regulator [Deltaproteobacteria bacterium]
MAFNVLIVDDSSPMRAVMRKTVTISGFDIGECYEASNGREALEVLGKQWVDLIITDYNMPEMNGMELIASMKKEELLSAIPVVVVSTEGSQQIINTFMEQGAARYIQKPFTPEEIRQKLNNILGDPDGQGSAEGGDEDLDF